MQPLMPIQARCKLYFCYKSESDKVVRACEWSVTHQNASDVKMSCVCNKSTPLLLYLVPHCYCAWSPIVTALIPPLLLHLIPHCYCTRYLTVTALGPPLLLHLVPTVTALGPSLLLRLIHYLRLSCRSRGKYIEVPPLPDTVLEEWAWAMGPLLQCLHTHEGTMVHFVSVCARAWCVRICGYMCVY